MEIDAPQKENEEGETEKINENPNEKAPPEGGLKMKFVFITFGIGSLLAWNAILSDIGFFINYQNDYNPSVSFSFLNFVLNITFQFFLIWKKQLMSFKKQLIIGLIASIISLVVLPLVVIAFIPDNPDEKYDQKTSFTITAVIILLQGLINAICSNGFFAMVSFFPLEMIISLSTGQGISGILMNVIQYAVLYFVNTGDGEKDIKLGAIIFFSLSSLILLICLILLIIVFQSDYFKYYLEENNKVGQITTQSASDEPGELKEKDEQLVQSDDVPKIKEPSFKELFNMLMSIDLLTCFIYIVTFFLFPNVSINQRLFKTGKYRINTIIFCYNVFDTVGRALISKVKPTKSITYLVSLSRSILMFTLIFNHACEQRLEWNKTLVSILLLINVGILALTNGMGTTLCFGIAPTLVPLDMKGKAGSSVSFFLILGIFLGTCLAFGSNAIMELIGVYDPTTDE